MIYKVGAGSAVNKWQISAIFAIWIGKKAGLILPGLKSSLYWRQF